MTNSLFKVAVAEPTEIETEDAEDRKPDPDLSGLQLHGDGIIVRQYKPPRKKGSIILPPTVKKDAAYLQNIGKVLKVGSSAFKDPNVKPGEPRFPYGFFEEPKCKIGDWILYPRHSGQLMVYKGVKLLLICDNNVLMTVADPADFDINDVVLETNY